MSDKIKQTLEAVRAKLEAEKEAERQAQLKLAQEMQIIAESSEETEEWINTLSDDDVAAV